MPCFYINIHDVGLSPTRKRTSFRRYFNNLEVVLELVECLVHLIDGIAQGTPTAEVLKSSIQSHYRIEPSSDQTQIYEIHVESEHWAMLA